MEPWGAALFGDPCRECGFDWGLSPHDAVLRVASVGQHAREATRSLTGDERLEGWSVREYVSHLADNLRQWSERIQAARLAGVVVGYDPDELAAARGYRGIPLAVGLWSLEGAARRWERVLDAALEERIVLQHATRGPQHAADVARNNCHDAVHHLWDVRRIAAARSGEAPPR